MICFFIGCDRDAGEGELCPAHKKQRARGRPLTPIGTRVEEVPPCRKCRGRDFQVQTLRRPRDGAVYLSRYCVPCRAKLTRKWAKANPLKAKLASNKYRFANRERLNAQRRKVG
jgi:hypothetical protein